ncbi:succinate dehydrogenase assembly factor 2 [Amaricoccus tamworthensis]|uniref:FAD assembly factor SdhE n=1 Tax=Amaricoccus tamworthensis TaxID=57002 RepID=UPI003C7D0862
MTESPEHRLKRLRMRSWRRGTKEMDLILGPFADSALKELDSMDLDAFEALLVENDQDLYSWFSGRAPTPERHVKILDFVRSRHIGGLSR